MDVDLMNKQHSLSRSQLPKVPLCRQQGRSLTLSGNHSVPLHSSSPPLPDQQREQDPVTVHAFATYTLLPMSESVIPVCPKNPLPVGKMGLIEPSSKLIDRYHVCGASQLVSFSEEHTLAWVLSGIVFWNLPSHINSANIHSVPSHYLSHDFL